MRRLRSPFAAAVLTLTLTSCGGGGEAQAPLPTVTALSPDGVQHVHHTFSPDGKRVAYWSPATDSQNWQLWVANADLSAPVKLPVTVLNPNRAQWSPDGAFLAAPSSDFGFLQAVIVPAAGGAVRRVTEGAAISLPITWFRNGEGLNYFGTAAGGIVQSFVYSVASGERRALSPGEKRPHLGASSPDGSHVAYFVLDGAQSTVWVADGNGQNPRQLTTEGFEGLEQFHEWSPDGKELLYRSTRTGYPDLWIAPIDGGKPRQLTRDIRADYGGVWSKDGKWIAFLSTRGRQTDVWVVPAAGGPELRVTDSPEDEVLPVAWRSGTETLTFAVRTQKSGVWALNAADGKERRLTPDSVRVAYFRVSPDGQRVFYVVQKAGSVQDLAVVSIGGGEARTLIDGGGNVDLANWSPNGQQITFESDRGGSSDIWVVDVAGGAPRQITNWPGYEGHPVWAHDGQGIYFNADKDSKLGDAWRVPAAGGVPTRVTTAGNIGPLHAIPGAPALIAGAIGNAGQMTLARIGADGRSTNVWDKSSAFAPSASFKGDVVVANVEQAGGKMRSMLLRTDGSGGRVILEPGQSAQRLSADGQWVVYGLPAGGSNDLGLFRVADGVARRLTTTPQSEEGAEFTPDGKTVLFRRVETVQRIMAVDVAKLLAAKR